MSTKPQPPESATKLAEERIKQLDQLSPQCAWDKHACECTYQERAARVRWYAIMRRQQVYEEAYC